MGLDLLELVMVVEQGFDIEITDEEASILGLLVCYAILWSEN